MVCMYADVKFEVGVPSSQTEASKASVLMQAARERVRCRLEKGLVAAEDIGVHVWVASGLPIHRQSGAFAIVYSWTSPG
jgi:hypothetical protein